VVDVVAGRDCLDLGERRAFKAAGQHEMAAYPIAADGELGEGHADLEGDAGLFGQDRDRAEFLQHA